MDADQRIRLERLERHLRYHGSWMWAGDVRDLLTDYDTAVVLVSDALPALKSWTRNGDHEGSPELYDRAKRLAGAIYNAGED